MTKDRYIVKTKYALGVIVAIIAAFSILTSQSFYYSLQTVKKDIQVEKKTDNPSGDQADADLLSAANDLQTSVLQTPIEKVVLLIIEIPFNENSDLSRLKDVPSNYNTYFRTLFRRIISPNAP